MPAITITEALQEIKTIQKRISNNRAVIRQYLYRTGSARDPLEKDGGCVQFIQQKRQAVADLERRLIDLRVGIQDVNLLTELTVGKTTMTVTEWLTWRKELAEAHERHLAELNAALVNARQQVQQRGGKTTSDEKEASSSDVIVHINEKALMEEIEYNTAVLGELDGKLSLINATTTFEV